MEQSAVDYRLLYALDAYEQDNVSDYHTEAAARYFCVARRFARKFLRYRWKIAYMQPLITLYEEIEGR